MIVINAVGNISGSILTISTLSYIGIGLRHLPLNGEPFFRG